MADFSEASLADLVAVQEQLASLQAALDGKSSTGHTHAWAGLTDKPTTVAGFGLVDVYTKAEVDALAFGGGGGGVTDHGALTGLGDDDHPQYFDQTRGDLRYYTKSAVQFIRDTLQADIDTKAAGDHVHALNDMSDVNAPTPADGEALVWDAASSKYIAAAVAAGGVTDHGALTGKADDDHPQYHTDARGDARYYTKAQTDQKTVSYLHKSAAYTANTMEDITVDASGGALTITAPAAPAAGAIFWVHDLKGQSATNNITVDLGTAGFEGTAGEDFIIDVAGYRAGFKFIDGTWWEI